MSWIQRSKVLCSYPLKLLTFTGSSKPIDGILSSWTEWSRSDLECYQYYEGYSYQDSAYSNYDKSNPYKYYEDAKRTSECTCEKENDVESMPKFEIQLRS